MAQRESLLRRIHRARSVVTGFAICLVASLTAVLAPMATGPAGASAPTTLAYLILTTSPLHVTSSTHHKLEVVIDSEMNTSDAFENFAYVQIGNQRESHRWQFTNSHPVLSQTSTGAALIMHNAQLGPYGLLKLIATNVGKSKTSTCGDGDYTVIQHVSVTGRLFFNTRSTGRQRWGGIGNKNKNLTFSSKSTLDTGYGTGGLDCNDYATPCSNGPELTVFGATTIISAQTIGKKTTLGFIRGVRLSKPKGAARLDEVSATANRPKIIISTGKPVGAATLSLTVPKSSSATGSFELLGGMTPTTTTDLCNRNGAHSSQTDKVWNSAGYIDGTPHISVPEQIFGRLGLLHTPPGAASFRILSPVS
jgi:hypothetical protein